MDNFVKYQRIIMLAVIVIAVLAGVLLLLLLPEKWSLASGVGLGVIGGLVVLRIKVLAIYRFSLNPQTPPVKTGFQTNAIMIGFLAVAVLVNKYIGAGKEIFNVWTTLAGLILPNAVLMADGFFRPPLKDVSDVEE